MSTPLQRSTGPASLSPAQYRQLIRELRQLIDRGRDRAERAVGRELVLTYHQLGSRIVARGILADAHGSAVLQRLADDLGCAVSVLQRAVLFARTYPAAPPESGLRWAHYRELLALPDPAQRAWYEARAAEQGWTRAKLVEAIRERRFGEAPARSAPRAEGKLRRPRQATYVYAARVERVVDGDTLLALVDLGFQVHKSQRLRLAAIDAPARGSAEGDRARAFVAEQLAAAELVMIKTEKIDLYGRYVAHVFYLPGERDRLTVFSRGRYLNQVLVDHGFARPLV